MHYNLLAFDEMPKFNCRSNIRNGSTANVFRKLFSIFSGYNKAVEKLVVI